MKKNIFSTFIFISTLALVATFTSCETTEAEPVAGTKEETTFINTKVNADSKLYTTIVFSKINSVTATNIYNSKKQEISAEDCKYNSATSELKIPSTAVSGRADDYIFHIVGVPLFPAEFILANGIYSKTKPAIFINGKIAEEGKDYNFNPKTNHLAFVIPLDADKDSYYFIWTTPYGRNSLSNNTDKFASQYNLLERQWINSIR